MKKINVIILVSFILASVLGVLGQDLSYFMSENIIAFHPVYYLTAFTLISIALYIISFALLLTAYRKQKHKADFEGYFFLIFIVGASVSSWAIFVLAMWWG